MLVRRFLLNIHREPGSHGIWLHANHQCNSIDKPAVDACYLGSSFRRVAMHSLRSWLSGLYAVVGATMLFNEFFRLDLHRHPRNYPSGFNLLGLAVSVFLLVTGCLFLLAAASFWRKWRSGRVWCLSVGVMNLLVPVFVGYFLWRYGRGAIAATLTANGLLLGLGVISILAFWRWDPAADKKTAAPVMTSARPGDGTSTFLNRTYFAVGSIVFFLIWMAWKQWAHKRGMPSPSLLEGIPQLTIAELAAVFLHECGHALCGIVLGQKVLSFIAGPFQWRRHIEGHWKFKLNPAGFLSTGGATAVVAQRLGEPKWRELCVDFCGAGVNFVTGVVGLWAASRTPDSPWERYCFLLAMFGSISLMAALGNLVPLRTNSGYSDGARIYQLLRSGVWADLHEAYRISVATTVTALRPRDYNINALHRVKAAGIVEGPSELLLHLLAHSHYTDRGQLDRAGDELREAEKIYDGCAVQVPAKLLPMFVMEEALAKRDAARARLWWDRLEAKKPTWFNGDYWMARSALCWVEGNRDEARAAWAKAKEYLNRMPDVGTYAFDRESLALLKTRIEADSSVKAPISVP